jgi:hypothetical protein
MSAIIQLTVQNVTPQKRGLFLLGRRLETSHANSIGLGAWQRFVLAPGDAGYTAITRDAQVVARSQMPNAHHQTVLVAAESGTAWTFQLDADNAPELLAAGRSSSPDEVAVTNKSAGTALIGFYNNFASLLPAVPVEPHEILLRQPVGNLYFYASVPLVIERQPIVLDAAIGELTVPTASSRLIAEFRQDNNTLSWRFV